MIKMSGVASKVWERYSRQVLFAPIGRVGQERLLRSRVAVIGLGALGTVSANSLARAGVGYLKLVDRDYVEESNLQRQILFDEEDAKRVIPKALAAAEKLKRINSSLQYEALIEDVNYTNVLDIIGDVDLVLDATDNFETRFLVNEACVKKSVPWIYGACVASSGLTFTIIPGETPCLACFLGGLPSAGIGETCDTAGVISPVVNVIASVQVAEALKLLTGAKPALNRKALFFDLWENQFSEVEVMQNDNCPVCGQRTFDLLAGKMQQRSTYLCGRDAVQVLPPLKLNLSLEKLRDKLLPLGDVSTNDFLLKFTTGKHELVVFPDGRALIKGTSDEKMARALYARYIGA
jgi:adenylyltransferase/sulfurtransferase